MLFNTLQFGIFFILVFFLYWFVFNKSLKKQNIFLVICSYFFYACWDWRFMFLLGFSTFLDYFSGLRIEKAHGKKEKKIWLILSVTINLGFLGFFKYYNFFIESFADLLRVIGFNPHITTLSIILPVGISFYTFHGLSYVFDIYNGKVKARKNLIDYSLFVCFFPLLVAGPIERATHLLPQVEKERSFDYIKAVDGLKQVLWGLFKKIVIADGCAPIVDSIFKNYESQPGSSLALGAILFAIQIYGDFSGYTDIALGVARILGFELLQNFRFPYFSRDIAEFWRRWHISLSSWFKDYLYIPLGGSRKGMAKTIQNTFIIFLVSGFWHGANWTFLFWGGLHAFYMLPSIILKTNRKNIEIVAYNRSYPSLKEAGEMLLTFILVSFAWIFFRSDSITSAFKYIQNIFSESFFEIPAIDSPILMVIIVLFFLIEWKGRRGKYAIESVGNQWSKSVRWTFYYIILGISIFYFYQDSPQQFIYFQF